MTNSVMRFFNNKQTQKWLWIGAAILIGLYLLKPDMTLQITTGSIFGGFAAGITIATLVIVVGAILLITPALPLGIVLIVVGLIIGGITTMLSFIAAITKYWYVVALGIGLIVYLKYFKRKKR